MQGWSLPLCLSRIFSGKLTVIMLCRYCGGLVPKLCSALATTWTVAHKAPLSMRFSRQEYWSGFPFPSPRGLPDPEIEPVSLVVPALVEDSLPLGHLGSPPCLDYMPFPGEQFGS